MTSPRYYETVALDEELGPLVKRPTPMRLVMYAAATWEFARIHYDAQPRGER
jgi:hydroxyacyl-ACP dehydratase HTD2-like protein with hotdog domain